LFDLVEQFREDPAVSAMHSYKPMQRVHSAQSHVETDDAGSPQETIKKPAEIPSDSLQNPSDPDAAYSGHKGQGYQVQIMETFSRSEDENKKEQTLRLYNRHIEMKTSKQAMSSQKCDLGKILHRTTAIKYTHTPHMFLMECILRFPLQSIKKME